MTTLPILDVRALTKTYSTGAGVLTVLGAVTFALEPGATCSILGPSGSGKSTLLGLCAGLDRPTSGTVRLNGIALEEIGEDARARVRNEQVGFVFQNFQLIPTLTALENVMVPLELRGDRSAKNLAADLLRRVGLETRTGHYPAQLSGGEQQRVALARALAPDPAILVADEPTGNLDEATGKQIVDLLFTKHSERGMTLVLVTHDTSLAQRCDRVVRLRSGRIDGHSV